MIYLNGIDTTSTNDYQGIQQSSSQPRTLINKNNPMGTDSVSFSGNSEGNKDKKNLTAYVIGGLVLAIGGILLTINLKKGKTNSGDIINDAKKGMEDLDKNGLGPVHASQKSDKSSNVSSVIPSITRSKVHSSSKSPVDYKLKDSHDKLNNAQKQLDDTIKMVEKEKLINQQHEENLKRTNNFINESEKDLEKMRQDFKEFCQNVKEEWEKADARREKYWKEFQSKNFNMNIDIKDMIKLRGGAEQGLNIFRKLGKDSSGKAFEEIAVLGSVDNISADKLKKAHWKLSKKYGPILNTGSEKEKAEATMIMQQINPANDNIRMYIEIKQKNNSN